MDKLAVRNRNIMLRALQQWFSSTNKQIRHALTEKFAKDITSELTDWEFIEEEGNRIIKPASLEFIRTGGQKAYKLFKVSAAFDVLNVRAVKAAEKHTARLVKDVTANTKKGIRTFIAAGIKDGQTMDKIARDIRPLIGLTKPQTQSVINYKKILQEKRPDLTAAEIDSRTNKYAAKTHRRRAITIARTETARAQTIGYVEGLQNLGLKQVQFQVHPDERTCAECLGLNRTKYSVEEGSGIIPVHPNCRCAMLPVIDKTPACDTVRKAAAPCIPPENLKQEQIKDLLERPETSIVRSASRLLGYKELIF